MPHKPSAATGFRFVVSPITTSMVDVEPMPQLAKATEAALRTKANALKLDGVVLFPMVTQKSIYPRSDFVTHKRSSNAFYVGQNINFDVWKRARRAGRLRLALKNFHSSISAIPDRHLSSEEKALIYTALERAARKVAQNAA